MSVADLLHDTLPGAAARPVFRRFGRSFHLRLADAADLHHILDLDEAHWVATSAPTLTINADPVFLGLLDSDGDGRVRVAELRAATAWLFEHLVDPSCIRAGNTELKLNAIERGAPDGEAIHLAAGKVCGRTGEPGRSAITLQDARRILNSEEAGSLGSSGLVPPQAAADKSLRGFLEDVLATVGGEEHPSGQLAVNEAGLQRFFDEAAAYLAWQDRLAGDTGVAIMPLGEATPRIFDTFKRLEEPLDRYFALCRVAAVSRFVQEVFAAVPAKLEHFEFSNSGSIQAFLARAPLAAPRAEAVLDLHGPLNPFYADDLKALVQACPQRLPGKEGELRITEPGWGALKRILEAHSDWAAARPETRVGELGVDRLRACVEKPFYRETAESLLADSHARAIVVDNLRLVEKLILYQAYLLPLANSFVSFPDLYNPASRALFEMGTLIMDGRHFTLSVRVPDRERHVRLSEQSNIFMLYVEVSEIDGGESYEVAVPVTAGGKGRLQVGTWGIFQDVDGSERHARVVQIVENPISLSEAIAAPFRRLGRAIARKLQEITSAAEKKLSKVGAETITQVADVSRTSAPAAPSTGGMLAGGGIAIAALGSSAAFITKTLSTLSWQGTLGGFSLAALAVVLPTAVFAHMRLRARDLSSLLEGSGWAVNARMWLTGTQARGFTYEPSYGSGLTSAQIALQRLSWLLLLLLIGLLLWGAEHFGVVEALRDLAGGSEP